MPITTTFRVCTISDGLDLALYSTSHSPLSLFHVAEFKVDDCSYNSLQQYYQSEKADFSMILPQTLKYYTNNPRGSNDDWVIALPVIWIIKNGI